jgi:hypothetical protein
MTLNMFDASTPPATAPADFEAAAGYIGGDTPHVWTSAEWDRFRHLYKLPVYVRSNDGTDPVTDAFAALEQLYRLGVPMGKGLRVALDLETRVAPAYVDGFHAVLAWAGYRVWVYGSASTLFGNPACEGYWVADYAGKGPFMYSHSLVRATQWTAGKEYDSSLVTAVHPERFWK